VFACVYKIGALILTEFTVAMVRPIEPMAMIAIAAVCRAAAAAARHGFLDLRVGSRTKH
jgi:hypothetical protein